MTRRRTWRWSGWFGEGGSVGTEEMRLEGGLIAERRYEMGLWGLFDHILRV